MNPARRQSLLGPLALGLLWLAALWQLAPQWWILPQYNYGWAVPFLSFFLFWQRWKIRPAPKKVFPPVSFYIVVGIIILTLLFARLVHEANLLWRVTSWTLVLSALSLTFCALRLAGGWRWVKHFAFATAFILVAVPWPSRIEQAVVQGLTRMNVSAIVEALGFLGVPAIQRGNVIEISTGLVGIDEACSGIRSLQATLMIALFFGEFFRLRVARRILLVAVGVAMAFIFNAIRTFTLVLIASQKGINAIGGWHDPAGLTILVGCFLMLWLVAVKMRGKINAASASSSETQRGSLNIPRNFSFALIGLVLLMEAGTELWYRSHETKTTPAPPWTIRQPDDSSVRKIFLSPDVRGQMRADVAQSFRWTDNDGTSWQLFYFVWHPGKTVFDRVKVQAAKRHRPEICLPASGLELRKRPDAVEFQTVAGEIKFQRYDFDDRGLPLRVYFCVAGGHSPEGAENTVRSRLSAALRGNRGAGQQILEIAVWGLADDAEADEAVKKQLARFVVAGNADIPVGQ